MALMNLDDGSLDRLPKHRKDFLEVFGNQWTPVKQMPGTCEACVWGERRYSHICKPEPTVPDIFEAWASVSDDMWNALTEGGKQFYANAMNADLIAGQVEVIETSLNPPYVR